MTISDFLFIALGFVAILGTLYVLTVIPGPPKGQRHDHTD